LLCKVQKKFIFKISVAYRYGYNKMRLIATILVINLIVVFENSELRRSLLKSWLLFVFKNFVQLSLFYIDRTFPFAIKFVVK